MKTSKILLKILFLLIFFSVLMIESHAESPKLIPYLKGEYWGFCDFDKKVIIEPKFNSVYPFLEGFSVVKVNEKYGMIDESGKIIIPIKYDNVTDFYDGISTVQDGENYGGFDKTGNIVIPFSYYYFKSLKNGTMIIDSSWNYGLMNTKGEKLTEIHFGSAERLTDNIIRVLLNGNLFVLNNQGFSVNRKGFDLIDEEHGGYCRVKLKGKWGFMDTTGKIAVELNYDEVRNFFPSGVAPFKSNWKWGLIDTKGNVVVDTLYDEIGEEFSFGIDWNSNDFGFIKARKDGKTGFIDAAGNVKVPFKYEMTGMWRGGYCPVYTADQKPSRLTLIDKNGKEMFESTDKYNSVGEFSEGMISAGFNGYKKMMGYIDVTSKEIIPLQFEETNAFKNGVAIVKKDGFFGLIDKTGKNVTDFKYKKIENVYNSSDVYKVNFDGWEYYINNNGIEYFDK